MNPTTESIFSEIGTLASQNKAFFRAIKEAVMTIQNYWLSANLRELEKELFYYRDENGVWQETDPTGIENSKYEHHGTTNEEVLMVLISRLNHQQAQQPCQLSEQALIKLREAQMWLNSRQSRMILEDFRDQKIAEQFKHQKKDRSRQ